MKVRVKFTSVLTRLVPPSCSEFEIHAEDEAPLAHYLTSRPLLHLIISNNGRTIIRS